ncbi:uncharacterized protein F4822DRAFT_430117 [Hypoxylon trugodes]|uniref:uncharacterized protein n=1 Tax=Hypoxylon trugodes TaxID=326681 RepID=UPI00219EC330|nr:uncharacterized protein F4822DRAFT_430117 [Hypoxylon trugodes]KAI1387365.1 hypothetical protein F4822DRAFT_430117 [Hypoxylon trugodes]
MGKQSEPSTPKRPTMAHPTKPQKRQSIKLPPKSSTRPNRRVSRILAERGRTSLPQPEPVQQRPYNLRPRSPHFVIIYEDGHHGRLRSVYNRITRQYVYQHRRDQNKKIRMSFVRGKLERLQNIRTQEILFHKDRS